MVVIYLSYSNHILHKVMDQLLKPAHNSIYLDTCACCEEFHMAHISYSFRGFDCLLGYTRKLMDLVP